MNFMPEAPPKQGVNKILVGAIALGCLAIAAGLWAIDSEQAGLLAAFWRIGLVMSALWLALPKKGEAFAWERAVPLIVGAIIVIAVGRRALPIALPILIVIALAAVFIRPRPKRRHTPPPPRR